MMSSGSNTTGRAAICRMRDSQPRSSRWSPLCGRPRIHRESELGNTITACKTRGRKNLQPMHSVDCRRANRSLREACPKRKLGPRAGQRIATAQVGLHAVSFKQLSDSGGQICSTGQIPVSMPGRGHAVHVQSHRAGETAPS